MPKKDLVRRIDQEQRESRPAAPGGARASSTSDAATLNGWPPSLTPSAYAIPVAGGDGKLDPRWLPDEAASTATGLNGQVYVAPWVRLARPLVGSATTMVVNDNQVLAVGDTAILSHATRQNEQIRIIGGPTEVGAYWQYDIERGDNPHDFPAHSYVINLGGQADGGYITMVSGDQSGSGLRGAHLNMWAADGQGGWKRRLKLGRLGGLSATEKAYFPQEDDWDVYGLYAENVYLRGQFYAEGGSIAGNLTVNGKLIVDGGAGDSRLEMGQTAAGWGWSLRNAAGRPVVSALAPYVDEAGNESDVAFIIEHEGRKGFYYHKVGDSYRLDIGVDTLVGGAFRVGERFLVGQGEWGADFSGVAIDSQYGFVGLSSSDTFDTDPEAGTFQTWWDRRTGTFKFAQGDIEMGAGGMLIYTEQEPFTPHHQIRWRYKGTDYDYMTLGTLGYGNGLWMVQDEAGRTSYINMMPGGNIYITALTEGDEIQLHAGPGGAIRFFVGNEEVTSIGGEGGGFDLTLPLTLFGSDTFVHWDERGWMGMGTHTPDAVLDILHGTGPHLRIGSSVSDYATWTIQDGNAWWTTTGDIVLDPASDDIVPATPFDISLGSPFRRFLAIYAAELNVETLVAQEKIATIGGSVVVSPTTKLAYDVQATDTVIYVEHNEMTVGDIVLLQDRSGSSYVIEFMQITSGPTPAGNYYEYGVTRDLDGTGANKWAAGAAVVNTGQTGDGWIDMYSVHGINAPSKHGPTITGNVRTGTAYNAWEERWAIGNLNGVYGYGNTTYGVAFGKYGGVYMTIDDSNGIRIFNGSGLVAQWALDGSITITDDRTLDDIPDGTLYGRVLAGNLDAGDILLSMAKGDLDDISDGMTYGRVQKASLSAAGLVLLDQTVDGTYGKVLATAISAGKILLSEAVGDLDDIADGTNYGRVLSTAISAGKISLTTGVVGVLPEANTEATVGADWYTNLTGIPVRFQDSPSAAGLYMTTTAMGYYNGTEWTVYIDSSGDMFLKSGLGSGDYIGLSTNDPNNYRFWIGDPNPGSSPFYVKKDGYFTSTYGRIGGFTITGTTLENGNLKIDSANQRIGFGSAWMYWDSGNSRVYCNSWFSASKLSASELVIDGPADIGTGYAHVYIAASGGWIDAEGGYRYNGAAGVSGTFTNPTSITVQGGIVTAVS